MHEIDNAGCMPGKKKKGEERSNVIGLMDRVAFA